MVVTICQLPVDEVDSFLWRDAEAPCGIGTDSELEFKFIVEKKKHIHCLFDIQRCDNFI